MIEPRLAYNYAILDENDCCVGCKTYSYQVPLDNYISVPRASNQYYEKYYDRQTGLWYYDAAHTQIFDTSSL